MSRCHATMPRITLPCGHIRSLTATLLSATPAPRAAVMVVVDYPVLGQLRSSDQGDTVAPADGVAAVDYWFAGPA